MSIAIKRQLVEWIRDEREALWADFSAQCRSAIRPPVPSARATWSMAIDDLATRIQVASRLLGSPTPWSKIDWGGFPFYETIEGTALPAKAWDLVREYGAESMSAQWALQFAPGPE